MENVQDVPLGYLLAESLDVVDVHGNHVTQLPYVTCGPDMARDCVTYGPIPPIPFCSILFVNHFHFFDIKILAFSNPLLNLNHFQDFLL